MEQLIIDVNQSVLTAITDGIDVAFSFFKKAYRDSKNTGENAYIIPASINWGIANNKKGNNLLAHEILTDVELLLKEYYTDYVLLVWHKDMHASFKNNSKKVVGF